MFKPQYHITPYLLNLVDQASALREWINNAHLKLSWLPIMQKESKVRQAHFSTSIEGNPLSLSQVKAVVRGEKIGALQQHEKEIHNYISAVKYIQANHNALIDETQVLKLHKILMKDLLEEAKCGIYKQKQNYVINENGIRVFIPPSPKNTPQMVGELFNWLNSNDTKELHCVLVCAIAHHRLVSIHPFSDGNGRIARLIATWILYQREFDTNHIFSLDEFFAGDRQRYYMKLQQARELDDNLSSWIEYVAEGIVFTLKNAKKRIEELQVSIHSDLALTPKQEELLRILRDDAPLMANELTKKMHVTRARINQLISPMISEGIVERSGLSKATRYAIKWKSQ